MTTGKHRRAQHRANEGIGRPRRKARARESWKVAIRRDYTGEDMERVVKHRRSPPRDGTRKTVRIPGYWRRERYIASRAYRPKTRRHKARR